MSTTDPVQGAGVCPPPRRRAARIGRALGAALALYLTFEAGRFAAGYNIIGAVRERDAQQATIVRLEHAERALQAQLLELQTVNAAHAREAQVITRTIADLQAHVARLSETLAFYKDVVAQGAPPIGLRVGEVLLASGRRAGHYRLHLSLLRADRPDGAVSGTVSVSVDGVGPGRATLDNRSLTGSSTGMRYRFRYYQELREDLVLPPGFKPKYLTVTVRARHAHIAPLIRAYPWDVIGVP